MSLHCLFSVTADCFSPSPSADFPTVFSLRASLNTLFFLPPFTALPIKCARFLYPSLLFLCCLGDILWYTTYSLEQPGPYSLSLSDLSCSIPVSATIFSSMLRNTPIPGLPFQPPCCSGLSFLLRFPPHWLLSLPHFLNLMDLCQSGSSSLGFYSKYTLFLLPKQKKYPTDLCYSRIMY